MIISHYQELSKQDKLKFVHSQIQESPPTPNKNLKQNLKCLINYQNIDQILKLKICQPNEINTFVVSLSLIHRFMSDCPSDLLSLTFLSSNEEPFVRVGVGVIQNRILNVIKQGNRMFCIFLLTKLKLDTFLVSVSKEQKTLKENFINLLQSF